MDLYYNLTVYFGLFCVGEVGGDECRASALQEPTLEYHSDDTGTLTGGRHPAAGQCQVGSLTGAVASERVTEASKGHLSTVGNRASSAKA